MTYGHQTKRELGPRRNILWRQLTRSQQKRNRAQGIPLFIPDKAQLLKCRDVLLIQAQQIQVLDLRLVVLAGFKVAIGACHHARLSPREMTATNSCRHERDRREYWDNGFQGWFRAHR